MLTYATYADWCRIRKVTDAAAVETGERVITDYLAKATNYINSVTHRRFFPFWETRLYAIPVTYRDLNNRADIFEDLSLNYDLLEAVNVQTGADRATVSTQETLQSALTRYATTFTATDADGLDANGNRRYNVYDLLLIDNEFLFVVGVNTTTNVITVQRGALKSTPAAHASGTTIFKKVMVTLDAAQDYFPLNFNINPHHSLRLVFPNTWSGGYVGAAYRYQYPQILVTALWGYHEDYRGAWIDTLEVVPQGAFSSGFSDGFNGVLENTSITATQTTIQMEDVDGDDVTGMPRLEAGMMLRIDDELLEVTDADATTNVITVVRGINGSTATTHTAGVPVYRWDVHQEVREVCYSIAATWRNRDESVNGRQGVSDNPQDARPNIDPADAQILTRLVRSRI